MRRDKDGEHWHALILPTQGPKIPVAPGRPAGRAILRSKHRQHGPGPGHMARFGLCHFVIAGTRVGFHPENSRLVSFPPAIAKLKLVGE